MPAVNTMLRALRKTLHGWRMSTRWLERGLGMLLWISISLPGMLMLAGCSRSDVAVSLNIITPTAEIRRTKVPSIKSLETPSYAEPDGYAAVWVSAEDSLMVHQPAGLSGTVIRELPYDARNLELTGQHTLLGSSRWSEIRLDHGVVGWVPAWNLMEDVSPSAFCADERVDDLRRELIAAVTAQDGDAFSSLINPQRGVVIRYQWYMDEMLLSADQVVTQFDSGEDRVWGQLADSGIELRGSFTQVVLPKLLDVLENPHQEACNQLVLGDSPKDLPWPSEFDNLNFLALHRAAPEGGNGYDWRTWILGIEYVDGKPTLGLLLQYSIEF